MNLGAKWIGIFQILLDLFHSFRWYLVRRLYRSGPFRGKMSRGKKDIQSARLLAGVGLTSLGTLMLQVSLTRLFSVSLWHHFAFMVVSISFMGFRAVLFLAALFCSLVLEVLVLQNLAHHGHKDHA